MVEHHTAHAHHSELAHHFEDLDQQRDSAELGMWLFLVTEFMFFGGLFMAYLAYRYWYPVGFALASHEMNIPLGTINTAVLLTSSFTMALAVSAARQSKRKELILLLLATIILGAVFLVVKAFEYQAKYEHHLIPFGGLPFEWKHDDLHGAQVFLFLYFVMTGLHALHMVIGMVLMLVLVYYVQRGKWMGEHSSIVHNAGLYWHFVDLVWVYLFPFFYLVAARGGVSPGGH